LLSQNYTPGNPATVLYIKNLAKDVTHDDFFYVFGKAVRLTLFRAFFSSIFVLKENVMVVGPARPGPTIL
jgi:hypothetical protein